MCYEIQRMNVCHFEEILAVDAECFRRKNRRTVSNLRCLYENFPEGCFVATVNHAVVGYLFCHRFGNVGYLGPLAVNETFRTQGIAKTFISQGVAALQHGGCIVIGLETLAEWGNNIGLYYAAGFVLTYPTILGHFDRMFPEPTQKLVDGHGIEDAQIARYDATFTQHYSGYSLLDDMQHTIQHHPEMIYCSLHHGEIQGFLAYDKDVYPFIWGSIYPAFQPQIFCNLYAALQGKTGQQKLPLRINARYDVLQELLTLGFRVEKAAVRMLLRDYEGEFLQRVRDHAVVFRAWVA